MGLKSLFSISCIESYERNNPSLLYIQCLLKICKAKKEGNEFSVILLVNFYFIYQNRRKNVGIMEIPIRKYRLPLFHSHYLQKRQVQLLCLFWLVVLSRI